MGGSKIRKAFVARAGDHGDIRCVCPGLFKCLRGGPCQRLRNRVAGVAKVDIASKVERFAITRAGRAATGSNFSPVGIANWHVREPRQEGAAERTRGGKKGTAECVHGTSKHANHCAPARGLRWRKVERQWTSFQAEDAPLFGAREFATLCGKYTPTETSAARRGMLLG